jgi:diguanylate cyclase (GGDEF)-like protein
MPANSDASKRVQQTVRDGLTAAFTRPYFLKLLGDERRFALEMNNPFCVCLIDIDQLRKVNEALGMHGGDAILAAVADLLRGLLDVPQWQSLRALLGRYDGDSLILLMPGCRLERAEQFAHSVRQRIEEIDREGMSITASLAIAALKGDDSDDDLLNRLEKTMCLAKQFGGNSVEVSRTAELTRDLASVTRLPVTWPGRPAKSA